MLSSTLGGGQPVSPVAIPYICASNEAMKPRLPQQTLLQDYYMTCFSRRVLLIKIQVCLHKIAPSSWLFPVPYSTLMYRHWVPLAACNLLTADIDLCSALLKLLSWVKQQCLALEDNPSSKLLSYTEVYRPKPCRLPSKALSATVHNRNLVKISRLVIDQSSWLFLSPRSPHIPSLVQLTQGKYLPHLFENMESLRSLSFPHWPARPGGGVGGSSVGHHHFQTCTTVSSWTCKKSGWRVLQVS